MDYLKKLFIAKVLVTLAIIIYTAHPLITALDWFAVTNLIAFPVLMYVVWGGLHGTGRSVRLVAFLGMAYILGYFISLSGLVPGATGKYLHSSLLVFALLAVGVLFSIKRGKQAE